MWVLDHAVDRIEPVGRERTRVVLEALALALITALPLLTYFVYLYRHPIERFALAGDYAGLELATRYVPSGRTLLGPYSRFGFSHPGPLYFYALAPVYALCGSTSAGIFAGACAVNAVSVMTIVGAVRIATTRVHAVAVALVLLGWLGAFGSVCALPWNPLVVVLPLMAFLVLAALVATGSWRALPFCVLAGAFAAETHLSTIPAVAGIALTMAVVVALRARRGHPLGREEKVCALVGLAVLLVVVAPPIIEEIVTPDGNITKLARFFASRKEPMRPLTAAISDWGFAAAWLPDRLPAASLMTEAFPDVMRSDAPPLASSGTDTRSAIALVLAAVIAAVIAIRRRDYLGISLLGLGALTSALSVLALRAIVGVNFIYLLFWTTAATTVIWMGVVATLSAAFTDLIRRSSADPRLSRFGWWSALVALLVIALRVSALQRGYLAHETLRPPVDVVEREAYRAIRMRLAQTGETPVFHAQGAWHYGLAFLLEASKDGVDARVVERDRWILGRQSRGMEGAARTLHVFVEVPDARVFVRGCLEKLTTIGTVVIYTSPVDVEDCPSKP
jgi:hypothetical protein